MPELKKRCVTVRALVRDASRASVAHQVGADETVVGDLRESDSLRAAAEGVDGVFHINPAFPSEKVDMVEAAKAAGVRKFIFSSIIHPSISKMVNHEAKGLVEEVLPVVRWQTLCGR